MSELNENEMEALRALWRGGAQKPAEIQARFSWKIENATLRSVLALLVEKKLVSRGKRGKAFFYRAAASPRGVLSRLTRTLAHVFTGGSTAGLIAQLLRTEKLTAEEIRELRAVAAERADDASKKR